MTRPIPGWEGLYEAGNSGDIFSVARVVMRSNGHPQTVPARKLALSYRVGRGRKDYAITLHRAGAAHGMRHLVARLVASAFIPNPLNKPQVNHINGDHFDNRVANLEWATPGENVRHAVATGLVPLGEQRRGTKLNAETVRSIRSLYAAGGTTHRALASRFGVGSARVTEIINGKAWRHVSC